MCSSQPWATTLPRPRNQTSTNGWHAPPTPVPTPSTTSPPSSHNSTTLRQTRSTRHCGHSMPNSPGSSRRCRPSSQAPGCSSGGAREDRISRPAARSRAPGRSGRPDLRRHPRSRPRPRPDLHARRHRLGLTPPCAGPRYSTAWNATSEAKSPSHDRRSRCGHSARDRPGGKHPRLTLLHLSLSRRAGTRIAGLQRRAPRKDQQEGRAAAAQVRGQMPVERPVTGPESDQDDHRG